MGRSLNGQPFAKLTPVEIRTLRRITRGRRGRAFARLSGIPDHVIALLKNGHQSILPNVEKVRANLGVAPAELTRLANHPTREPNSKALAVIKAKVPTNGAAPLLVEAEPVTVTLARLKGFLEGQLVTSMAALRFVEGGGAR